MSADEQDGRRRAILGTVFERFTDRARRVLVLARDEAQGLGHNYIGTEHLLLALPAAGGVAAMALASFDVTYDDIRLRAQEAVGHVEPTGTMAPAFSPRAKKVLELALRESLQLGHNFIGTEHLLLALVREGEGTAGRLLDALGAGPEVVRQAVMALLSPEHVEGKRLEVSSVGPRCARCGEALSRSARYRRLSVPPEDSGGKGRQPVVFFVVYCIECGTALGQVTGMATMVSPQLTRGSRPMVRRTGQARFSARPKRERELPAELMSPVDLSDIPVDCLVSMSLTDHNFEGTVGAVPVALRLDGRRGTTLSGSWGSTPLTASWASESNYDNPGPGATLSARFGAEEVHLEGTFKLGPDYFFRRTELKGTAAGQDIVLTVVGADGGYSSSTIFAEGSWGDLAVEIWATVDLGSRRALLRGTVGGKKLALDIGLSPAGAAQPRHGDESSLVPVVGSYDGPPALLFLALGAVANFL